MTLTTNIKNNSKIHHLTHLGFFQLCFYSVPGIKQVRNIISIDLNMYLTSCYMFLKIQLETSSGQTENILPHAATNKKGIFCSVGFCSLCQCISPHANQWKPAITQSVKELTVSDGLHLVHPHFLLFPSASVSHADQPVLSRKGL